jgi:hypothetical protein
MISTVIGIFCIGLILVFFGAIICTSWFDAGKRSVMSVEDCETLARAHEDLDALYERLKASNTPHDAQGWRKVAEKKLKKLGRASIEPDSINPR